MLVGISVALAICDSRHVRKEDGECRAGEAGQRVWCSGGVMIMTAAGS